MAVRCGRPQPWQCQTLTIRSEPSCGGWALIERGLANGEREREAVSAAMWLAAHGARHGFRTPNAQERARAMGMAEYLGSLQQLGLDDHQVFFAQGGSFDRAAVALRMRDAVMAWLAGDDIPRHEYPPPMVVEQIYVWLRGSVQRTGGDGVPIPASKGHP